MALKQFSKKIETYVNQGYILSVDANFLINAHEVLAKMDNIPISISKEVFNELDQLKNAPANATPFEVKRARDAREGFTVLDDARATIIDSAPSDLFATYNLSNSGVEKVVADYLHYRDSENKKIVFLTLDEEAQAVAHAAGLECADLNIPKFHKQRERELSVYTSDEIASGKKLHGFYRFNRKVYFLYRDIKRIGKYIVYTALILGGVIYAIASM